LSFTVGQRRGLKIAKGYPLYVVSVDKSSNTVVVGRKEQGCRKDLIASGINWIAMESLRQPLVTNARIRYKHPENSARVIPLSEDRVKVEFLEPQMAVTPGQAVVFYEDEMVLGGGWIDQPRLPLQE
jgi:tRNA-specific 2-thiouridylase